MSRSVFVVVFAVLSACGPSGPNGIAFVRISELNGACPVERTGTGSPPKFPDDLEFRRSHATMGVRGDSIFTGGNVITTAWKEPGGRITRMYIDVGPDRGYGATVSPSTSWTQAVGYVEWLDGVRVFSATRADGTITYEASTVDESGGAFKDFSGPPPPGKAPGALFAHHWFTGVDDLGNTMCRLIALHADATQLREEPYDPSWLAANPTVLIVEGQAPKAPTFDGDQAPSASLVSPDKAPKDPGSAPPRLDFKGGTLNEGVGGGGNACD